MTSKHAKTSNPFIHADEVCAGVDYSLRGAAICVIPPYKEETPIVPFDSCEFHFLTTIKSCAIDIGNIHGTLIGSWKSDSERYESIAEWSVGVFEKLKCRSIGLEDYAFHASNSSALTQLAENCGLLKYFCYQKDIAVTKYSITSIKRFACSNGKADKSLMYDAWLSDHGVDLNGVFGRNPDAKIKSPVSDIVDSYYIACLHRIENCATNIIYEGKEIE